MKDVLNDLIGKPYSIKIGPEFHKNGHDPSNGLNCQFLAHEAIWRIFNAQLPAELKSAEIFQPNPFFDPVENLESIKTGDILLFSKPFRLNPKLIHLTVFTGRHNPSSGSPILIHANYADRVVSEWSLDQFANHDIRPSELVGIRRFNQVVRNLSKS